MIETPWTCRAIPKYAPPFLAVLIGRHHRVISELRSRPPSPRGASGPVGRPLHLEVKLAAGTVARLERLLEKSEESLQVEAGRNRLTRCSSLGGAASG